MTAGFKLKDNRHACEVVRSLGITYQLSVGQSMCDSFEFWNCENVPENLPESLEVMDWNPMKRVGWGLSKEEAESIRDYKKTKVNKGGVDDE